MHYFWNICILLIVVQTSAKPSRKACKQGEQLLEGKQLESTPRKKNNTIDKDNALLPQRRDSHQNELTWPGGIVFYKFAKEYPVNAKSKKVKHAMHTIEVETCIKFVEDADDKERHVEIRNEGECSSMIGYIPDPKVRMIMNLNAKICTRGMILHELLHVLGFQHEHSRLDRDEKVKIMWENVKDAKQFEKIPTKRKLNLPYDFHSIMHVKPNAYSKNGAKTIVPLFPGVELIMGQRISLTTMDIVRINRLYNCTEKYQGVDLWEIL